MRADSKFVDIHCHLLPGLDDGARSWDETLQMARIAAAEGISTIVTTPRQLGSFSHNRGELIRRRTEQLQDFLLAHSLDMEVLAGAAVLAEKSLVKGLRDGSVLTLGDHKRHVLLQAPAQWDPSIEDLINQLAEVEMVAIWSRVERNQQLAKDRKRIREMVEQGSLMQITAGSLLGTFGPVAQTMAEWMLSNDLVHFVSTAARGARSHRPLIARAFHRVQELTCAEIAQAVCCTNPSAVARGETVPELPEWQRPRQRSWWRWRKAG